MSPDDRHHLSTTTYATAETGARPDYYDMMMQPPQVQPQPEHFGGHMQSAYGPDGSGFGAGGSAILNSALPFPGQHQLPPVTTTQQTIPPAGITPGTTAEDANRPDQQLDHQLGRQSKETGGDNGPKGATASLSGGADGANPPMRRSSSWLERTVGTFVGKFVKSKNEMILPDDSKKSIVWDEQKQRWVNQTGDDDEVSAPPPPPSDSMLLGGGAAVRGGPGEPSGPGSQAPRKPAPGPRQAMAPALATVEPGPVPGQFMSPTSAALTTTLPSDRLGGDQIGVVEGLAAAQQHHLLEQNQEPLQQNVEVQQPQQQLTDSTTAATSPMQQQQQSSASQQQPPSLQFGLPKSRGSARSRYVDVFSASSSSAANTGSGGSGGTGVANSNDCQQQKQQSFSADAAAQYAQNGVPMPPAFPNTGLLPCTQAIIGNNSSSGPSYFIPQPAVQVAGDLSDGTNGVGAESPFSTPQSADDLTAASSGGAYGNDGGAASSIGGHMPSVGQPQQLHAQHATDAAGAAGGGGGFQFFNPAQFVTPPSAGGSAAAAPQAGSGQAVATQKRRGFFSR
jgi:hypothetical protein